MENILTKQDYIDYINILKEELIPALGCTEPISISYAAARASEILNNEADEVFINCSGNVLKNAKSVIVPNSGGMKGIKAAVALGLVSKSSDKKLEVLLDITDEDIKKAEAILKKDIIKLGVIEDIPGLHIAIELKNNNHSSYVEIVGEHTNIVLEKKDGVAIFNIDNTKSNNKSYYNTIFSIKKILDFSKNVEISALEKVIETQIECNSAISKEGLINSYGVHVGRILIECGGESVRNRAVAKAAAGSDARMSGCQLPVVINSGSGNQGMTVSIPVIEYAKELDSSKEELYRALILSNLINIYIKKGIGRLSAFCGVVSASCGTGAGITFLKGGSYENIADTITNTLGNVSGIVCDGAKPSCASKIASSVDAAILAHNMAMRGRVLGAGEGIIKENVDETIKYIGLIASEGMRNTDKKILEIMVGH